MPGQYIWVNRACDQCRQPFEGWRKAKNILFFCSQPCVTAHRRAVASTQARFWAKVDRHGPVQPHRPELGPCWVWTGPAISASSPYGCFWRPDSTSHAAHRYSWELHHGPVPDGLNVLHKCDNPPCVRPDHLFLGTDADNAADRDAKGRGSGAKGTRNANAKVNPEIVRQMRQWRKDGMLLKDIAALVHLSIGVTHSIVTGATWKHV